MDEKAARPVDSPPAMTYHLMTIGSPAPSGIGRHEGPQPPCPGREPLLLLVDEGMGIALIVHRLGRWASHDVISYPDVASAWEHLAACLAQGEPRRPRPDLVAVDVHLPGPSGLELCRRLRETPALAGLPVALFSTWERTDDIAAGLQAGANFVLSKDLLDQPEAWRERVREILSSVDSQAAPVSLSFLQGLSPSQQTDRWLQAVNQALRLPAIRRLGREVLRVLIRRAGQRSQHSSGTAEWVLSD